MILSVIRKQIMIEINKLGFIADQIKAKVVLYQELYADTSSVAVLNAVDSQAFNIIKFSLLNGIVMSIASLFDPAKTGGTDNLTIKRLLARIEESVANEIEDIVLASGDNEQSDHNQTLITKVKNLKVFRAEIESLEQLYQKTGVKKYRNKIGAHNDVEFVTGEKSLKVDIDFESLSSLLEKIICVNGLAANLYSGADKDQFIHRKKGMPSTSGGNKVLKALQNRITTGSSGRLAKEE